MNFTTTLKRLIQEQKEIDEVGTRMKPHWSEEDQVLALYNEKYGLADVWPGEFRNDAQRREDFSNQVIGSTGASLLKQGLNFRWLRTKNTLSPEGYPREIELQRKVFEKYDRMDRHELKRIVIDIIENKLQNPDKSVSRYKEILKTKKLKSSRDKALEAQLKLHDLNPEGYPLPKGYIPDKPEKRYNIRTSESKQPEDILIESKVDKEIKRITGIMKIS